MVFDFPGTGLGQPLGWLGLGIFLLGSLPGVPLGSFLRIRLKENRRMYHRAQAMVLASKARTSVAETQDQPLVEAKKRRGFTLPEVTLRSSTQAFLRLFLLIGVVFGFLWAWAGEYRSPDFQLFGPVHPQVLGDYLVTLFSTFEVQAGVVVLFVAGFFWSLFGARFRGIVLALILGWILLGATAIAGSGEVLEYRVSSGPDLYPSLSISLPASNTSQDQTLYRRVFLEGYRIPIWIQFFGFHSLYLSSYRIESGVLVVEDPQIPWVFLLRPDSSSPPEAGYLLSPLVARVFSSFVTRGLAEPFAVRSGFLEIDKLTGSFPVFLPLVDR